ATSVGTACRQAGWRVAMIDHRPFGGTCVLRGCDPKKVLRAAAEAVAAKERLQEKDIIVGDADIDWAALQRFKRSFTDPVPASREQAFGKRGIDTFHGKARFAGPDRIQVGDTALQGRHILIATGAE